MSGQVILETQRLRTVQHPNRVGDLVDSLIGSKNFLPKHVTRVTSASLLPAPLRLLSRCIDRRDCVWRSWTDGNQIWFFEASFSLDLSRERGKPVIQLREYDEASEIVRVLTFVSTGHHQWQQCE